jgi:hypothetical protein
MSYCIDINKNINNMIIRFKLDNDVPEDFIKKWVELKFKCEGWTKTDCRKETIESWLKYCKIETNKKLPLLKRCEVGIGGNDNTKHKQIRFRSYNAGRSDNNILINQIYNTNYEKWSIEELNDLINAFIMYAENYINGNMIGFIKIKIESDKESNKESNKESDKESDNGSKDESQNNNKIYVLEVIKFISKSDGPDGWINKGGNQEHLGYMKANFKTKEDACSYYDRHNPHMRGLNAHGTFESDWDPKTELLYIVREDYGLIDNIPPFSKDDLPINGSYKYLK